MTNQSLTQERLKELLHYCPDTGIFTWNNSGTGRKLIAGSVRKKDGYRCIHISHKKYAEHRLVFLYVEGSFPANHVDHINRIRDDNR